MTVQYVKRSGTVMSSSSGPLDCNPPGSSVHGILQARRLEWVAIPFSRGSSQPRDRISVSRIVEVGKKKNTERESGKGPLEKFL